MKNREQIISDMCHTWRHDYGLIKDEHSDLLSSGMTKKQRQELWNKMEQIFDNCFSDIFKRSAEINKLVFIVSGNYNEFKEYYNAKAPNTKALNAKYMYLSEATQLIGSINPQVEFIGTWINRPDIIQIIELIKTRTR